MILAPMASLIENWRARVKYCVVVLATLATGCAAPVAGLPASLGGASDKNASAIGDQQWSCGALENAIQVQVTKMVALRAKAKAESEQPPANLERMYSRWLGPAGSDSPSMEKLKAERATADGYNDVLRKKNCASVDIDAKIASAPAPPIKADDPKPASNKRKSGIGGI